MIWKILLLNIDKVISYTTWNGILITEEDIDAVCITQVTNKIFDMITAIANRQTKKAMDLYEDLLTLKSRLCVSCFSLQGSLTRSCR